MALGWNEIKDRSIRFSKDWEMACNESFLIEFFNVIGIGSY